MARRDIELPIGAVLGGMKLRLVVVGHAGWRITEATGRTLNGLRARADVRTYVRIAVRMLRHWRGDALGLTEGGSREGTEPARPGGRAGEDLDAPEALGINFHEVRAKSALNKVPGDYLPFNWTVNAFRGCAHACTYCQSGETPVLMAAGRPRALADLPGGRPHLRNGSRGEVQAIRHHGSPGPLGAVKEAYRITLEDGTELVASGDHRYWTRRGKWKYVIGAQQGPLQRPHLTLNDQLAGIGGFAEGPDTNAPVYRRGYLCGLLRGDANLKTYADRRPERAGQRLYRFRLALADFEALRRAQEYLAELDMHLKEFVFAAVSANTREIRAIRDQSRAGYERITDVIAWPRGASDLWCRASSPAYPTARAHTTAGFSGSRTVIRRSSIGLLGRSAVLGSTMP